MSSVSTSSSTSSELPPGWFEVSDKNGKTYYWHEDSGTTQWEKPVVRAGPPPPPVRSVYDSKGSERADLLSGWIEVYSGDGTPYYWNESKNIAQWEKPVLARPSSTRSITEKNLVAELASTFGNQVSRSSVSKQQPPLSPTANSSMPAKTALPSRPSSIKTNSSSSESSFSKGSILPPPPPQPTVPEKKMTTTSPTEKKMSNPPPTVPSKERLPKMSNLSPPKPAEMNSEVLQPPATPVSRNLSTTLTLAVDGSKKTFADLIQGTEVVGLYFSAYKSSLCRNFNPVLTECYKELFRQDCLANRSRRFEIMLVSSDKDEQSYDQHRMQMPFPALEFSNSYMNEKLSKQHQVNGLCHLVILNSKTGETLVENAVGAIRNDPYGEKFPWTVTPQAGLENYRKSKPTSSSAPSGAYMNDYGQPAPGNPNYRQPDPYARNAQPDPYERNTQPDPYARNAQPAPPYANAQPAPSYQEGQATSAPDNRPRATDAASKSVAEAARNVSNVVTLVSGARYLKGIF